MDYPVTDYTPLVRGHYTLEAPEVASGTNPAGTDTVPTVCVAGLAARMLRCDRASSPSRYHIPVLANTAKWILDSEDNQVIEPGVELTFPWASTDGEMRPYATVARLAGPSAGISFGRYGSKLYVVVENYVVARKGRYCHAHRIILIQFKRICGCRNILDHSTGFLADVGANTGDMYAVTNTLNPGVTVTTGVPCLASGFQAGATAADGATMYGFFQSIGFIQVSFGVPAAAQQPVGLGLKIERQWIFSNTTDRKR